MPLHRQPRAPQQQRAARLTAAAAPAGSGGNAAMATAVVVKDASTVKEASVVEFTSSSDVGPLSSQGPLHSSDTPSGTSGSVVLERPSPNKATEVMNIVFVTSEVGGWVGGTCLRARRRRAMRGSRQGWGGARRHWQGKAGLCRTASRLDGAGSLD